MSSKNNLVIPADDPGFRAVFAGRVTGRKLEPTPEPDPPSIPFPLWHTVRIGCRRTHRDYLRVARGLGGRVDAGVSVYGLIERIPLASEPVDLDLFEATMADLGFRKAATLGLIRERVREFGLGQCPEETALALHEQYHAIDPSVRRRVVLTSAILDKLGHERLLTLGPEKPGTWRLGMVHGVYVSEFLPFETLVLARDRK